MKKKKILLSIIFLYVFALVMLGCEGKKTSSNQTNVQNKSNISVSDENGKETLSNQTNVQQEDVQKQPEEFFINGDYEKSRELYKDVGNQKKVSECTYLIAKNYLEQKDYASAIKEFETISNYKDVADYLDKCRMKLKYEKFDYDEFLKLMDESMSFMTNKEIRKYVEEVITPMYLTWYDNDDNSMEVNQYAIDGKTYRILSYDNSGRYDNITISYLEDEKTKHYLILDTACEYADVTDEPTMGLTIDNNFYKSFTNKKAEEYVELREKAEEEEEYYATTEYYLPGYAYNNSLGVYVYYACIGYDEKQNINLVSVQCTIWNNGSDNIQFAASDYFSLNYNGVITNARPTQYDYTTLASGGQFTTELVFDCPSATRTSDTFNMTLIMENTQIHLGPAPQTEEEQSNFSGVYMDSSPSYDFVWIVTDAGNGTYDIISVDDVFGVRTYQGITLKENNKFKRGNGNFRWKPNKHVIYSYDDIEETWVESYQKQNPLK